MGNIVLLDEQTINKIAAGEVIERPASVIKEMVENSIDAGATNITVEIKNGGISYIKVSDNGKGIAQDDLEIAFERHATSKIRSADDLNTVTSMGFRGEALASIAAIANVEMISKTQEQDIGYRVVVEAGDVLEKEETAAPVGTTITVKNLFFNTPVRYKFLKKDYTEAGYIEDVITRIALVNPNIAFKLINTGKTVIQTNGDGELKNVIYSIYGKDIANGIMEVNYKYEDLNIIGVIGKPEIARSNRSNQLFFVNKRYIKDKILTSATEQAYKGLIPIGKFGFAILNIEMNPAKVDVNVHPAKLEVRFEEENKVFQAIYHAIKDTLLKSELVANTEKKPEIDNPVFGTNRNLTFEERLKNIRENKKENTGGLFSFRKNAEKQIEDYTEQESKIKTNNILEDIYESKQKEKLVENISENDQEKNEEKDIKSSVGEPINTADVLTQLKQMKEKLEKEVQSNSVSSEEGVKEDSEAYKLQIEKETENENIEENKEQNKEQNEIIEKTSEAIENLKNQEINSEFKQIKQKMEKLQDTPQVVTEDFNEMYKKLFGTLPVEDKEEPKKDQDNTAVDIIKDNVSMFENAEEYQKPV